ncbi:hypothetical protein DFH09DRAFT_1379831 [Mycena vulgaris]|nr:hypothetical protein DFH09DRAFT_1379831 [Mycena vulgaris]
MADKLADQGRQEDAAPIVDLNIPRSVLVPGVKLRGITQLSAYKLIRAQKMKRPQYQEALDRTATVRNIIYAQDAAAGDGENIPTAAQIWKSVRHKDITRSIQYFLWMVIHEGYALVDHWRHFTGYEDRGICNKCGVPESITHILTQCDENGQETIWEMVSELWELKTGTKLCPPLMGEIMACGLIKKGNLPGKTDAGTTRLYRITISESAHLIWRLRNERVLNGKDPSTITEICNRWVHALNIEMDRERALAQPPNDSSHESAQKTVLNRPSRIETTPLEILTRIFSICRDDVWIWDDNRDPEEDDGDENKIDPESIFDPRVAPMLLGRVCPSFREAALQTPLLWDIVTFTTHDLVSTGRLPGIQTILARSGNLPLTIHFSTPSRSDQDVLKNGTAQFLQRIWEFHPRFKHLSFFISCADVQLDSLPAPTTLQLLRSLDISIIGTSETSPGLSAFLRVFGDAPLLRSLTLYNTSPVDATSHIFHPDFFPWHQLTKLISIISVTTTTARDILRHCHRLEICELGNLKPVDILHQPPLCILNQMRSLDLSTTGDLPFIGFFDSLAFPRLKSLTLNSFAVPGDSLLELHGRSQSQIQHLAMESLRLTPDEIIQLLRLMPSLQMFSLATSHCAGNIFAALTYHGDPTVASLVLPNLKEWAVTENADFLSWTNHPAVDDGADGVAVVEMAESLQRFTSQVRNSLPLSKPGWRQCVPRDVWSIIV